MNRLLLLVFLITSFGAKAQSYMTKELRQPKFFLIGVENSSMPSPIINWSDTNNLKTYGINISEWLMTHKVAIDTSSSNLNTLSYHDFANLNNQQIQLFKKIEKQLSYILEPQKKALIKIYNQDNPPSKGINSDFYYHNTQVYILHKRDIDYLKKQIY